MNSLGKPVASASSVELMLLVTLGMPLARASSLELMYVLIALSTSSVKLTYTLIALSPPMVAFSYVGVSEAKASGNFKRCLAYNSTGAFFL